MKPVLTLRVLEHQVKSGSGTTREGNGVSTEEGGQIQHARQLHLKGMMCHDCRVAVVTVTLGRHRKAPIHYARLLELKVISWQEPWVALGQEAPANSLK